MLAKARIATIIAALTLAGGCGSEAASSPDQTPTGLSPTARRTQPTRPTTPATPTRTPTRTEPRTSGAAPPPAKPARENNTVSGHVRDQSGRPVAGAEIQFYIIPRSFGSLYRTNTGADGSYAYALPAGVYNVMASYYFSDKPGDEANLVTVSGDGSVPITVPPGHTIDFRMS